ncbi:MAG: arylesterase [Candidatus Muproteobacteria bacterium RBG_16_64_11]|uniref:Arylesterase n=1 Tax=Candidatus Muproteobacteria bacterium RBG_16_64_11 TaxID=1817758 RepID=A0A1F6TF26_9PROT|nr:MAG: arylesterase [Candidatus Muproteobacteria bacterium RBG_16_64_11]
MRAGALLALAAGLAACSERPPRLAPLAADAVIVAFGDSITYGSGANSIESYPAVLAGLAGRTAINAGVPGELSADGLKRLPAVLDEHRPHLLILCHGGNDLLRKLDEETLASNLEAMVRLAEERGAAVVLIGVPKLGFGLAVPDLYKRLANARKLPYEGKIVATIEGDRALKSDPIHPNAAGYRLLAQRIHALLKETGAL